mmetsp:Transcript_34731/g.50991  ORF Transcript_34731/g.50991 Transcript_34731/m.50991 type:complete len:94 (+) Transcript_34731:93-374(+)
MFALLDDLIQCEEHALRWLSLSQDLLERSSAIQDRSSRQYDELCRRYIMKEVGGCHSEGFHWFVLSNISVTRAKMVKNRDPRFSPGSFIFALT